MIGTLNNCYSNFQKPNFNTPKVTKLRFNPSFCALERTFVMLKPDSFERNLAKPIEDVFALHGLKIIKSWTGLAPRTKLENNYIEHKAKPFFSDWIDFLQSHQIEAMIIEGDEAVSKTRNLALKIREIFAPNEKRMNLIHSSDSLDSAKREIENFFDESSKVQ